MPDYQSLKNEVLNDPAALGYAGKTNAQVAALMNGATIVTQRARTIIPASEVIDATVPADWTALSSAEKQRYQTLTGAGQVNVQSDNVRNSFLAMFPAGSQTRTNLGNLQTESVSVSRAVSVFGVPVTDQDIARARSI